MDRDAEIDQIKRELEILRARYALYARWGRILKVFFMVWVPMLAIFVLALIVKVFLFDALYGAFFLGIILITAAVYWLSRDPPPAGERGRFRWIDLASPPITPIGVIGYIDPPFPLPPRPSDARVIEQQIAERERRLSELGASP